MAYGGVAAPTAAPAVSETSPIAASQSPVSTGAYKGVAAPKMTASPSTPAVPTPFTAPLFGTTKSTVDPSQAFTTPASKMESNAGTNIANQINDAFTSSVQQGEQGATEIKGGEGPLDAIASGLKVESGVAGALFSPIAPLTNLIGQGIQMTGNALADTPIMQKFAATATPSDIKVLTALQNLGTVAMAIVGAKTGDEVPPEQLESIANDPKVIAAAQKVVDARKAAEPAAQAQSLPVKEVPDTLFQKSTEAGVKGAAKPTNMDPILRGEIRDNLQQHGTSATHAALQDELKMTPEQSIAHIREAPVPQNAAEEFNAHNTTMKNLLLKAPEDRALLAEPKQATALLGEGKKGASIQGEGFTATDKVDKGKVATMQAINNYRDAVAKFNDKPTPKSLDTVRTARAAMNDALAPKEAATEVVKAPKTKAVKVAANKPVLTAPKYLYHGTTEEAAASIEKNGFRPGSDDTIFGPRPTGLSLTDNKATAQEFAEHRATQAGGKPKIVEVDASGVKNVDITKYGNGNEHYIPPEEVKNLKTRSQVEAAEKTPVSIESQEPTKKETPPPLKTEPGESLIGKKIEAKAIQENLTKGFDKTATYNVKSFENASKAVADLINSGIDNARAVVRGEKEMPENATGGALREGMALYAKAHPAEAHDIAYDMANSPVIGTGSSVHAQELGSYRMGEESDTAGAKSLQDIKSAMVKKATPEAVKATRSAVNKAAKSVEGKINLPKSDMKWDSFLASIKC